MESGIQNLMLKRAFSGLPNLELWRCKQSQTFCERFYNLQCNNNIACIAGLKTLSSI